MAITPPAGQEPGISAAQLPNAGAMPPEPQSLSIQLDEKEHKEILTLCNKFKRSCITHARPKKLIQQRTYAYLKNKLMDGDLPPRPTSVGNLNPNDNSYQRPQLFVPVTRQTLKDLYSKIKLTIFPSEEDYCKIVSQTKDYEPLEQDLTKFFLYKLKDMLFTEKCGRFLLDLVAAGSGAAFPAIDDNKRWQWKFIPPQAIPPQFDPITQEIIAPPQEIPAMYQPTEVDEPPKVNLDCFDMMNFYIDPVAKDPEKARWVVLSQKCLQEIYDSSLYMNKDKLPEFVKKTVDDTRRDESTLRSGFNDLQSTFEDVDDVVDYDFFYFPYLKTSTQVYRNMLVGVAANQLIIRFHPNLQPRGLNPVVFCDYTPDPYSPYGISPLEDIMTIQRILNIIYNYIIETLARIGNRFVATEGTDIRNLFGAAGGVAIVPEGGTFQAITGDYAEIAQLLNFCGILKQEGTMTTGTSNPFQGAANIDFKKTATELQIMQENMISDLREVIEHICAMGITRILERLMYLMAELSEGEEEIRVEDPELGPQFIKVNFRVILEGKFRIELTGVNPSQSKMAQVNGMLQILEIAQSNPEMLKRLRNSGFEIVKMISILQGIRDIERIFLTETEVMQEDMVEQIKQKSVMIAAQAGDPDAQQLVMAMQGGSPDGGPPSQLPGNPGAQPVPEGGAPGEAMPAA